MHAQKARRERKRVGEGDGLTLLVEVTTTTITVTTIIIVITIITYSLLFSYLLCPTLPSCGNLGVVQPFICWPE